MTAELPTRSARPDTAPIGGWASRASTPGSDDRAAAERMFVTGGLTAAMELARAAAGDEDIVIVGGADIVQQALAAGVVDELRLHVIPVLLGAGTRLFDGASSGTVELERSSAVTTPNATHLTFQVGAER